MLSHDEVLDRIDDSPVNPAILADALGRSLAVVQAILWELEALGLARETAGRWVRAS